jgi:hypothetical protein
MLHFQKAKKTNTREDSGVFQSVFFHNPKTTPNQKTKLSQSQKGEETTALYKKRTVATHQKKQTQ